MLRPWSEFPDGDKNCIVLKDCANKDIITQVLLRLSKDNRKRAQNGSWSLCQIYRLDVFKILEHVCGLRRSLLLHRFPKNGKKWYICSSFWMVLTPLAGLPDFVGQGFICLQSAWTRIEQSTLSWVATATHCILHLRWEEDSFFLTFILVHCLFSQVFFFLLLSPRGRICALSLG